MTEEVMDHDTPDEFKGGDAADRYVQHLERLVGQLPWRPTT